jgi:hypothetical protein
MSKHGLIYYNHDNNKNCKICRQAKMTKKPLHTVHRNLQILELIHSDICELNNILTRGDRMSFITFIDDFSRYTYVYLMKNKDKAFGMFKRYKYEVENKKEKKIKILRTDRGG